MASDSQISSFIKFFEALTDDIPEDILDPVPLYGTTAGAPGAGAGVTIAAAPPPSALNFGAGFAAAEEKPDVESLFDTEAGKKVAAEIGQISVTANKITKDFETVRGVVHAFDAGKYLDGSGDRIMSLEEPWIKHQNNFDTYLKASRSSALNVKRAADRYALITDAYLNKRPAQATEKLPGLLDKLLKEIEPLATVSAQHMDDFQKLAKAIRLFVVDVNLAIADAKDGNQVVLDEIKTLDTEINTLLDDIKTLGDERDEFLKKATEAGKIGGGIITALILLAPLGMGLIAKAKKEEKELQAKAKAKQTEIDGKNTEITTKQAKIVTLKERSAQIEKAVASLTDVTPIITGVATQIDVITNIWSYLSRDLENLKNSLAALKKDQEGPDPDDDFLAELQLDQTHLGHVYKTVGSLFGTYASELGLKDEPPKPSS